MVREVGRHDELLARPNGVYARLYALQMFETGAAAAVAAPVASSAVNDPVVPHASTSHS